MKKILFASFLFISIVQIAVAQQMDKSWEQFLLQKFPDYLPSYVVANAKVVPVTKKDTKKTYQLFDKNTGTGVQGKLRIGDTLVVFNGTPFFATQQNMFIGIKVKKQKTKTSTIATRTPRERRPVDPRIIQTSVQVGQQVIGGILWRIQSTPRR